MNYNNNFSFSSQLKILILICETFNTKIKKRKLLYFKIIFKNAYWLFDMKNLVTQVINKAK